MQIIVHLRLRDVTFVVVCGSDRPRCAELRPRSSWHLGASRADCRTGQVSPRNAGRPVEPWRTAGTDCRRGTIALVVTRLGAIAPAGADEPQPSQQRGSPADRSTFGRPRSRRRSGQHQGRRCARQDATLQIPRWDCPPRWTISPLTLNAERRLPRSLRAIRVVMTEGQIYGRQPQQAGDYTGPTAEAGAANGSGAGFASCCPVPSIAKNFDPVKASS